MGQFDGRRLSVVRLGILVVLVLGAVFASLRGWTWFEENRELADASAPGFAGYVDVTATSQLGFSIPQFNAASRDAVLAFVVSMPKDPCQPAWGGAYSLDDAAAQLDLDRRIARRQQNGGAAMVSFGGQANTELAVGCADPARVYAAYAAVVKRYHVTAIDLDVEGAALDDTAAAQRRAHAIALLQRYHGTDVWLTLPVARTGLTDAGERMVRRMLANGVRLAGVDVMTMDYGDLPPGDTMGEAAEQALEAAHTQVQALYAEAGQRLSSVETWQHLGATAMIGQNDVAGEVFDLDDARALRSFADAHGLGRLSVWSLNRDRACGANYPDVTIVSGACSGVPQQPGAFAEALGGVRQGTSLVPKSPAATASASADPTVTPSDDPATSPYPVWHQDQVYVEGMRVVWHHNVYVAKWWTSGDVPDDPVQSAATSAWTLVGPVLPGEKPQPTPTVPAGTYPKWRSDRAYQEGDRVLFDGIAFVAQWWSQGQSPATPSTVNAPSPWRPLTVQEIKQGERGVGEPHAVATAALRRSAVTAPHRSGSPLRTPRSGLGKPPVGGRKAAVVLGVELDHGQLLVGQLASYLRRHACDQ